MSLSQGTPELAIVTILSVVVIVGILGFLGYFGARINQIVIGLFQVIYVPLERIAQWCRNAIHTVLAWLRNQAVAESPEGTTTHLSYYVFGAAFYSALTALFIYCDLGLLMQTLDAMFGMGTDYVSEEPLQLMAWGLLATTVVWPALIFDALGVTHLAPWVGRLTQFWRRIIMGICLFFLLVSMCAYISVPYWRYDVMKYSLTETSQTELSLDGFGEVPDFENLEEQLASLDAAEASAYQAPTWALFCIVILSAFSLIGGTMVSLTGALPAIKWTYLAVVAVALLPALALVTVVLNLLCLIFERAYLLLEECLNLIIAFGQRIISLVGWQPEVLEEKTPAPVGERNQEAPSAQEDAQVGLDSAEVVAPEVQPPEPTYRPAASGFDPFGNG